MPERWIGKGKRITVKQNRVRVTQVHPECKDLPQDRKIPSQHMPEQFRKAREGDHDRDKHKDQETSLDRHNRPANDGI
jgi:hypothetical protein